MSRLYFLPLFFAFLLSPLSEVAAQEYYFLGDKGFNALLSPSLSRMYPDEFANKYGGVALPNTGTWHPPVQHWVVYRYLGLRYWFEVTPPRSSDQMLQLLEGYIASNTAMQAEYERGTIRAYAHTFAKGQVVSVNDLMVDPENGEGKKHADELRQGLAGLERLLNQADGKAGQAERDGSPTGMEKAWEEMREAEIGLFMNGLIADARGVEIANKLRNQYKMPPPGTNPSGPGMLPPDEIIAALASEMRNGPFGEEGNGFNEQVMTDKHGKPIAGKKDLEDGNKGRKRPFNVKTPFAKWFTVVMQNIARYFGVEQLANRILFVAYMVAPEIFDACASFLAKCQLALTPKNLNDFLDKIADVYLSIEGMLPYLKKAYDLLHDGNLQELVKHIDWTKFDLGATLDVLGKAKVVPPETLNKIRQFVPIEIFSGKVLTNPELLREKVLSYGIDQAVVQVDKGLSKFGVSIAGLKGCINAKDKEACALDWTKNQAANLATSKIPGLRNHREAINLLMGNKPKEAFKVALLNELAARAGIPIHQTRKLYEALERGDLKEFVLSGAEIGAFKQTKCQSLSNAVIQDIRSGRASEATIREAAICGAELLGNKHVTPQRVADGWDIGKHMANSIRDHDSIGAWAEAEINRWKNTMRAELKALGYDDLQIKNVMMGTGALVLQDQLKKQLKVLGFDAPGAVEAVIAGDLERAIDLQMQKGIGSPVPLKEKLKQMGRLLDLRKQYLDRVVDETKKRLQDPNYLESEIHRRIAITSK